MIGENKSKNGRGKGVRSKPGRRNAIPQKAMIRDSITHRQKMTHRVQTAHSDTSKHDIFLLKKPQGIYSHKMNHQKVHTNPGQ